MQLSAVFSSSAIRECGSVNKNMLYSVFNRLISMFLKKYGQDIARKSVIRYAIAHHSWRQQNTVDSHRFFLVFSTVCIVIYPCQLSINLLNCVPNYRGLLKRSLTSIWRPQMRSMYMSKINPFVCFVSHQFARVHSPSGNHFTIF